MVSPQKSRKVYLWEGDEKRMKSRFIPCSELYINNNNFNLENKSIQ